MNKYHTHIFSYLEIHVLLIYYERPGGRGFGVLVIKFTNHPIPSNSEYMARLNLLELLWLDKIYEQF